MMKRYKKSFFPLQSEKRGVVVLASFEKTGFGLRWALGLLRKPVGA